MVLTTVNKLPSKVRERMKDVLYENDWGMNKQDLQGETLLRSESNPGFSPSLPCGTGKDRVAMARQTFGENKPGFSSTCCRSRKIWTPPTT